MLEPKRRMSQIFISDKDRKNPSLHDVSFITRVDQSIGCASDLPWVAIALDLGLPETSFESTFPSKGDHNGPYLRIYATGMSSMIFPFLDEVDGL
jgi:hypothetical protein